MENTPIYDQLLTQQQHTEQSEPTPTEATKAADKAEGLPWLRFFRG